MTSFDARARHAADAVRRRIAELPDHDDAGIRRAQRSRVRAVIPTAVAASVLIGAVAIAMPRIDSGTATGSGGAGGQAAETAAVMSGTLRPFDTCDAVLQYVKDRAPAYLIDRVNGGRSTVDAGAPAWRTGVPDQARDAASAAGAESGASSPEYSQTNVQEAGVDEPDIVKTDGRRIVAVARGRVHVITARDGDLTLRATLPGTSARNVFLAGDRLLVFSDADAPTAEPGSSWAGSRSSLTMYDLADLDHPERVATLTIDGEVLDARLVDHQVRVVTVASPDVDVPAPIFTRDGRVSTRSEEILRHAVAQSTVEDWIPSYVLLDGAGAQVSTGHLVACSDLARPEKFSGLDTVAVSTFGMDSALQVRSAVGVIAGGHQIYASSTSTYVATTEWSQDGAPATTSVHAFSTEPSGASSYHGSGEVPGTLLNQYAMSEHKGILRVATTVRQRRGWVSAREVTEGVVTTLAERDGVLRQLGQVSALGREDNESIRAVRFIDDRGYVVTFRQTDPLYVLDLRDPADPKVLGELKIPGYSGYLHPIGENLLLGVGQSGDLGTGTGVQFSLFDISDAASPRRVDTQTYGAGAAAAEFDPKAFLSWPARKLVIAPASLYGDDQGRGAFSGVLILRATDDGLDELGTLPVAAADGAASRSMIIGSTVYLLSDHALQTADLDTLRPVDHLIL